MEHGASLLHSTPAASSNLAGSSLPHFLWLGGVYACGFLVAYGAFLLDRQAAIRSVRRAALSSTGLASGIRSPRTTAADLREAMMASAVWPVLLLGTLAGPLWAASLRYLDRRSTANRRRLGLKHSLSIGDLVQGTSEQDRAARLLVLVAGVGKVRLIARSGDIAHREEAAEQSQPSEIAYVGEIETPFRPPARRPDPAHPATA